LLRVFNVAEFACHNVAAFAALKSKRDGLRRAGSPKLNSYCDYRRLSRTRQIDVLSAILKAIGNFVDVYTQVNQTAGASGDNASAYGCDREQDGETGSLSGRLACAESRPASCFTRAVTTFIPMPLTLC
jgi:hypothetical protein